MEQVPLLPKMKELKEMIAKVLSSLVKLRFHYKHSSKFLIIRASKVDSDELLSPKEILFIC